MLVLRNFELYTPEKPKFPDVKGVQYIRDEETKTDWYESCFLFREDTMKVIFESDGFIRLAGMDAVPMWPLGASIAEVEMKDVPKDFDYFTAPWAYIDGKLVPFVPSQEVQQERFEKKRTDLMSEASTRTETYQDMIEFGIDVEEAKVHLRAWKLYRIQLLNLKLGQDFPTSPV